jgi:hypothetical protein
MAQVETRKLIKGENGVVVNAGGDEEKAYRDMGYVGEGEEAPVVPVKKAPARKASAKDKA